MAASMLTTEATDDTRTATRKRLITVEEYYKMADIGIFRNNKHIELIEGELIEMAAMYAPHISTVMRISEIFGRATMWCLRKFVIPAQAGIHL